MSKLGKGTVNAMVATVREKFTDAIFFMGESGVQREMLFSEFEALLDRVVGAPEFADQEVSAVFVRVNPQLKIVAAVFFKISFNDDGSADHSWNLPLQHFAETAARGPDLGAGRIRLTCRSKCSIPWHQQQMWDPEMGAANSHFTLLQKSIDNNHLGLEYEEPDLPRSAHPAAGAVMADPGQQAALTAAQSKALTKKLERQLAEKMARHFQQAHRDKIANLLKEQRLRITALNNEREDRINQLRRQFSE